MKRYDSLRRFLSQLDLRSGPDGCWLWRGNKNTMGYGRFRHGGKPSFLAHRFAYIQAAGPIPAGLVLDHTCRVHACVRPIHLRVVTDRENVHAPGSQNPSRLNLSKTHCPQGHPYDEANTLTSPKGWRRCRTCRRAMHRRYRATVKALRGEMKK